MHKYSYIVDKSQKLTNFLFNLGLKSSQVAGLYKNKDVKINGVRCSEDKEVLSGQEITLFLPEEINKKYEIVYEDDNIIIVNKHEGIEVTGATGLEGLIKNSIPVHRLDRNTKGLLVMAKNKEAEQILLNAFKDKQVTKKYICEVVGDTNFKNDLKQAYLFKDAKKSFVYIYNAPKPLATKIETKFTTLKHGNATSVVECELLTGKTHQIRAHLAFLGHAIVGDGKYGKGEDNKKFKESTQKLYCYYLKFNNLPGKLNYLSQKEFVLYPNWYKPKN